MKTEENNKLIAEFMGYKVMEEDKFLTEDYPKGTDLNKVMVDVAMKYHTSWDWLMPVVEKIWTITGHRSLWYHEVNEETTIYGKTEAGVSNIADAYSAVVEFIKWYNEN